MMKSKNKTLVLYKILSACFNCFLNAKHFGQNHAPDQECIS